MKIIKLKINNFLLPLFFLVLFTAHSSYAVNTQNSPPTEEAPVVSEAQNQPPAPAEENENTTKKQEAPAQNQTEKTKPPENQNPPQNSTKKPEPPAKQDEKTEQSEADTKKTEPIKKETPDLEKSESETSKALDLPEVSDKEIQEISPSHTEFPQKNNKNIIKTAASWLLICIGLLIIMKVIISNAKIPKNYEPHIKNKHNFKSKKRKNKYNLKYK